MAVFFTAPTPPILAPPNAAKRFSLHPQPTALGFLLFLLPLLMQGS